MTHASDPLDDFLEGAGAATELGKRLETFGLALALPGIVIAVGLIAFVLFVHRGSPSDERRILLRAVVWCGMLALVGGIVETAGAVMVLGGDWVADLGDVRARGAFLRLVSGVMMTIGFFRRQVEASRPVEMVGILGATLGALSFAIDGHTLSEGNPFLHSALDIVHVLAAGTWIGGVLALLLIFVRRRRAGGPTSMASVFVRFSAVATLSIVSVAAAGAGMSFLIVDSLSDYYTTAWGRLLLIKIGLVALAGGIGAYNHYVIAPALDDDPEHPVMLPRARGTITAEVVVLLAVALITVLLTEASVNQTG